LHESNASATQVRDELTPKYFKSIEQFSVGVVWSGHTQKLACGDQLSNMKLIDFSQ